MILRICPTLRIEAVSRVTVQGGGRGAVGDIRISIVGLVTLQPDAAKLGTKYSVIYPPSRKLGGTSWNYS